MSKTLSKIHVKEFSRAQELEESILALNCADFVPRSWQYLGASLVDESNWYKSEITRELKDLDKPMPHTPVLHDSKWTGTMIRAADGGRGMCYETRRVDPTNLRKYKVWGAVPRTTGRAFWVRSIYVKQNGTVKVAENLLTDVPAPGSPKSFNGFKLELFPARPEQYTEASLGASVGATMSGILWPLVHKNWSVGFSAGSGSAYLRIPVSANGLKELFRLRDLESGMSRRAALAHVVRAHRRSVGESEVDVRSYLRGRAMFSWFGLRAMVVPPTDLMPQDWVTKINEEILRMTFVRSE